MSSKYEALDARVTRRSERAATLAEEHARALKTLNNDYRLVPVPPPKEDA